jgi:hypothetical protein
LPIGSVSFAPGEQFAGNPSRMAVVVSALRKAWLARQMIPHIRCRISEQLTGLGRIERAKFKWDIDFLCGTHTSPFGDGAAASILE